MQVKIIEICDKQIINVLALAANDDYRLRRLNRIYNGIIDDIIIEYIEENDNYPIDEIGEEYDPFEATS